MNAGSTEQLSRTQKAIATLYHGAFGLVDLAVGPATTLGGIIFLVSPYSHGDMKSALAGALGVYSGGAAIGDFMGRLGVVLPQVLRGERPISLRNEAVAVATLLGAGLFWGEAALDQRQPDVIGFAESAKDQIVQIVDAVVDAVHPTSPNSTR